jgi:AcrR family transcriptional regulator
VVYAESVATKREYQLKKRGEHMAETRRRIVEASVELHRTVGPAATQINEIASRAGVQRITVYSHFPDEVALFAACSTHWRSLHPAPDPAAWRTIADPAEKRRVALSAIYVWFRETEPMTANVLRDVDLKPALRPIIEGGLGRYLAAVHQFLVDTSGVRGTAKKRVIAAARAALDFHMWRALASLGDEEAAELAASLIELAANETPLR